jgi:hypothetical protein
MSALSQRVAGRFSASPAVTPSRVASRYLKVAASKELENLLKDALSELKKWKAWSGGFQFTLKDAQKGAEGLSPGEVWQDEFVAFWKPFDPIERRLIDISDAIVPVLADAMLWAEVTNYLDPPRGARIEDAISKVLFRDHPKKGSHIAYTVADLEAWDQKFTKWLDGAISGVNKVKAKAKKKGLI